MAQAAGHHPGYVVFVHLGATLEGGQGPGGPVGDDVAAQAIHIQLAAHRRDANA